MHLIRPYWLLAIVPVLGVCAWLWHSRRNGGGWQQVCDAHLLLHLKILGSKSRDGWFLVGMLFAFVLAVLALAGPSWKKRTVEGYEAQKPVVVLLNLSQSMLAQDVTPSRLQRAKYKIIDLLKQRRGGQVALLAYTQEPFVVTPLTQDSDTVINLLQVLTPDIMPVLGHNLEKALVQAQKIIQQAGYQHGQIIVVTDAGGGEGARAVAAQLAAAGSSVSVLAVGTTEGGPIKTASGQLLKDAQGNIVVSRLDRAGLTALAQSGHGRFVRLSADNRDVEQLQPVLTSSGEARRAREGVVLWEDEGHWLILLMLPLVLLTFRRGWL